MKCQLVVIAGPDAGRAFSIEDGQTLVIGRGHASDTKINDSGMVFKAHDTEKNRVGAVKVLTPDQGEPSS